MANSDLFAPPTPAELKSAQRVAPTATDMFAPPTKDEIIQATAPAGGDPAPAPANNVGMLSRRGLVTPGAEDIRGAGQMLDTLGGTVRTGLASSAGLALGKGEIVTPQDLIAAQKGEAPKSSEYLERLGMGAGPSLKDTPYVGSMLPDWNVRDAAGFVGDVLTDPLTHMMGGPKPAKTGLKDIAPTLAKPGTEEIQTAAKAMGVKPTQGMLTSDYVVRNLEDSLGQSPSIAGAAVRKEQRPIREAISNAVEGAVKDQSLQSDVDAGRKLREGVANYFEGRAAPIQGAYSELETATKGVPLDPKGLKRISKNIRNLDEAKFDSFEGHGIANKFADALEQATDANDLKILKSKAGNILRDQNASYEAKSIASQIADKLDQAQKNSLTRQAVKLAREEPIFPEAGKAFSSKQAASDAITIAEQDAKDSARGLIGKIKETNKGYKGLLEDARTFGKGSGVTKANKGMAATLNDIRSASPEEMASALFDQNNAEFTKFVKDKMPSQFEVARQQRLSQLVKQSGGDTNKILKISEKMGPEARELLFGSENVKNMGDANTLLQSIPGKVGASDTPRGMSFKDLMNPMQNVNDAARYGLLKGKKLSPAASALLQPSLLNRGLLNSMKKKGILEEPQGGLLQSKDGE